MVKITLTGYSFENHKYESKINPSGNINEPIFNFKKNQTDNYYNEDFTYNPLDKNNNVDPHWIRTYSSHNPKDNTKYNNVHKYVENYAAKQGNRTANIDALSNMICKLSDDYGIDPEITMVILAHETGGFVFTPKVMSDRAKYKGVGQVNYTIIETLYASFDDRNNKSISKHERAVAYDHRHCTQDQTRIDALKKLYPTPKDLWKAIETDVALGLEVGIMAFKMKLHAKGGDTKAALAGYCSEQYKLPDVSTAKMQYDIPLPQYRNTKA